MKTTQQIADELREYFHNEWKRSFRNINANTRYAKTNLENFDKGCVVRVVMDHIEIDINYEEYMWLVRDFNESCFLYQDKAVFLNVAKPLREIPRTLPGEWHWKPDDVKGNCPHCGCPMGRLNFYHRIENNIYERMTSKMKLETLINGEWRG